MYSKILVIDDDKFIHKVISRALEPVGFEVEYAFDGDSGIDQALAKKPDIILLDVEMPGANGYEVCQRLRNIETLNDVAIVFLSSQSSLRERLQGYEVGADDYLTKPFEKEHLIARLKVLSKYQEERSTLKEQYKLAQKTALSALTGTSEISIVMQFMEKTIRYNSVEEIVEGLIDTTNKFAIECCLCIPNDSGPNIWHSSDGTISPIEKELVEMSDPTKRFMDFGCRTVVHYHPVKMLVKNMPLENMDRYGRLKDLLPVLLSIVNTKLSSIKTYVALIDQSKDLRLSFTDIRKNLFTLASTIVDNRELSKSLSDKAIQDLNMKLMGMGLEADQESYLLEVIESSFSETLQAIDMGSQLRNSFSFILDNLSNTMAKHDSLLELFIFSQSVKENEVEDENNDDIELF
ncbi:PleD family two-component system response regulator [Colwelliaceae bacterium 6441]